MSPEDPLERLEYRAFKRVPRKVQLHFSVFRMSENHTCLGGFLGVFGKVKMFDKECRSMTSAQVCARSSTLTGLEGILVSVLRGFEAGVGRGYGRGRRREGVWERF